MLYFGLAMVGAEGPPLGGRLKPRTARPRKAGEAPKQHRTETKINQAKNKDKKLHTCIFTTFYLFMLNNSSHKDLAVLSQLNRLACTGPFWLSSSA